MRESSFDSSDPFAFKNLLILLTVWVMFFLSGGTSLFAQGLFLLLVGVLLFLQKKFSPISPRILDPLIILIPITILFAFLPHQLFNDSLWRFPLENDLHIHLPVTHTPQPWLTLHGLTLAMGGIFWLMILLNQPWHFQSQKLLLQIYVFAVTSFALLCILFFSLRYTPSFWHTDFPIGPFPNKNQTANFFAISSILSLGLCLDEVKRPSFRILFWLLTTLILLTALTLTGSRAGIIVFLIGIILSLLWVQLKKRSFAGMVALIALLITIISLIILSGSEASQRLSSFIHNQNLSDDFRWKLHLDTLNFIKANSFWGVGLENFSYLFSSFRVLSTVSPNRILHPESDWLWLVAETGWIPVLLILLISLIFFLRYLPSPESPSFILSSFCFGAFAAFLIHGCIDVSGHRLGTVLPAIMILSLGIRGKSVDQGFSCTSFFKHAFTVFFLLVGLLWILASTRLLPLHLPFAVKKDLSQPGKIIDPSKRITLTTQALSWSPLDWELYFLRASSFVVLDFSQANQDFRKANYLESVNPQVPFQEGIIWSEINWWQAASAWNQALQRQPSAGFFADLIHAAKNNPNLLEVLSQWSERKPEWKTVFLKYAPSDYTADELKQIFIHDPSLSQFNLQEKQHIFSALSKTNSLFELIPLITQENESIAWPWMAHSLAQKNHFEQAVTLSFQYLSEPELPSLDSTVTDETLRHTLMFNPKDIVTLLKLYQIQSQQKDLSAALKTLFKLSDLPTHPNYLDYLYAKTYSSLNQWEKSWLHLNKYIYDQKLYH